MRTSHTLIELTGFHRGVAGTTLTDQGQSFVTKGVTTSSVLYNINSGKSATVTEATATTLVAGTLRFEPGDFYRVSLPTPWTVQNTDTIIYDSECRVCGFSFPKEDLVKDRCVDCVDEPNDATS